MKIIRHSLVANEAHFSDVMADGRRIYVTQKATEWAKVILFSLSRFDIDTEVSEHTCLKRCHSLSNQRGIILFYFYPFLFLTELWFIYDDD